MDAFNDVGILNFYTDTTEGTLGAIQFVYGNQPKSFYVYKEVGGTYSLHTKFTERSLVKIRTNEETIKAIATVTIKDYNQSSDLFGYKPSKKEMMESGGKFDISGVFEGFVCKKDGLPRDVVEVIYKGRRMKFLVDDLTFNFPNFPTMFKGYSIPKNRVVRKGVKASLKDNRRTGLKRDSVCMVINTTKVGSKKYATVEFDNKLIKIIPSNKLKVI